MRCCNPECKEPFDHRQGRLIRFSGTSGNGNSSEVRQPSVQHYWLCGRCVQLFVFDFNSGVSLRIRPRSPESLEEQKFRAVSAA